MTTPRGTPLPGVEDQRHDDDQRAALDELLEDDPADLFENAPCGYVSTLPDGTIVKVNRTLCSWLGMPAERVLRTRLRDLLSVGGQVFHDTHLTPLLRMQGAAREVALDVVRGDGSLLPCLVNAIEVRGPDDRPLIVRVTLFEATARRRYELELLAAQRTAEASEVRSRTLQHFVSELAAAVTTADAAAVVVHRSRRAVRATGAALWLVEQGALDPGIEPDVLLSASENVPDRLLGALHDTAPGRVASVLSAGVRTVPVTESLRTVWPGLTAAAEAARVTDLLVVPVTTDGTHLGALLITLGPEPDGDLLSLDEPTGHRSLPQEEVELLLTLGRQAGQALERARLHEETARQAERSTFLLDAARMLARAAGVTETVERLAEMVVPRLADLCVLDLAGEQGMERVVARHGDPARQALVDRGRAWAPPHRDLPAPARLALAEGRTRWFSVADEPALAAMARDPEEVAVFRALELISLISVPLVAEGRPLGVMTLAVDRRRRPFTAPDVELAEQLGLQVSLMMAKAQRYELEASTSHVLQATLLPPPPPTVPGMTVAVRYLAATSGVEIGGDFYDVAPLPGQHVAIAVGDVVGHDITAAATMGQLRSVYRALLVESPSRAAVI